MVGERGGGNPGPVLRRMRLFRDGGICSDRRGLGLSPLTRIQCGLLGNDLFTTCNRRRHPIKFVGEAVNLLLLILCQTTFLGVGSCYGAFRFRLQLNKALLKRVEFNLRHNESPGRRMCAWDAKIARRRMSIEIVWQAVSALRAELAVLHCSPRTTCGVRAKCSGFVIWQTVDRWGGGCQGFFWPECEGVALRIDGMPIKG